MITTTTNPREYDIRIQELAKKAYRRSIKTAIGEQAELKQRADVLELNAQAQELDSNFKGQWTRFYFLKHLHNSRDCGSFRWNSRWQWLPELSGMSDEEAVAQYGSDLCSKCVKSAPVN